MIDVRDPDEIASSGGPLKQGASIAHNLPLKFIEEGCLKMDKESFQKTFGFAKPNMNDPIVMSCKGGIRSAKACAAAEKDGYKTILDNFEGAKGENFNN